MKQFFEVQDVVLVDNDVAFLASHGNPDDLVVASINETKSVKDLTGGYKPMDHSQTLPLDDFQLVGSFAEPPFDFGLVYTEQGGNKIGLFQLRQDNEEAPEKGIIAMAIPDSRGMKWMYGKSGFWDTMFASFVQMVSFKLKSRGKDMITDKGPIDRPVITDKPDPSDPVNAEAQQVKQMLLNLFSGGDFNLSLNVEGRTTSNGEAEISGNFSILFKGTQNEE